MVEKTDDRVLDLDRLVGLGAHGSILEVSPDSLISVCLWSLPREGAARWIRKIRESSHAVYTGMDEAVRNITLANSTAGGNEVIKNQ